MAKKPTNPVFTENIWNRSVKIVYDTGSCSRNWPIRPIITYYEVAEYESGRDKFSCRFMRNLDDSAANWQGRDYAVRDLSEEIVVEAEKRVRKLRADYDKAVSKGRKSWQYKKIEDFGKKYEMPKGFTSDMTIIDASYIGIYNPQEFIGAVRESGTEFSCPQAPLSDRYRQYTVAHEGDRAHYYHVKDRKLKEISAKQYAEWKFKE